MKILCVLLASAVLGMTSMRAPDQNQEQTAPPLSSIPVEMPPGDIEIANVESNGGMAMIAKCQGASVKSQRLYLGDGKIAVRYEATNHGFVTPRGPVNSAAIEIKQGDSVMFSSTKLEK